MLSCLLPPLCLCHNSHQQHCLCCGRQKMEQARVQEETRMKMDHARRLKQMRLSLEDEKRKRSEENARLRRQLELKQVHFCGECLMQHPGPACTTVLVHICSAVCYIRCSLVTPAALRNACQLSLQQIYRHIALRQSCNNFTHSGCGSCVCRKDDSFALLHRACAP